MLLSRSLVALRFSYSCVRRTREDAASIRRNSIYKRAPSVRLSAFDWAHVLIIGTMELYALLRSALGVGGAHSFGLRARSRRSRQQQDFTPRALLHQISPFKRSNKRHYPDQSGLRAV